MKRSMRLFTHTALILVLIFLSACSKEDELLNENVQAGSKAVEVHRDEFGVPHIYADSMEDLYKSYGYVMAQDRLFQLEMFKRANEGTAAAVFGEEYLAHDEKIRRDGHTDEAIQKMIDKMDPFAKEVIENFSSGIDRYVEEAMEDPKNKLSKEFEEYDLKPGNWTSVDVLRLYMASMTAFMDQEQELENASIYAKLLDEYDEEKAQAIFNDMVWINDLDAPTSSDSDASIGEGTPFANAKTLDQVAFAGEAVSSMREDFIEKRQELGVPLKVGSNAAIIGASKSESGNPIMFGGPQVGFTAPGFIYEVGLHGPDLDIQGSSFIGYPFIMFGATNDFAFTATAGYGDVSDIFEEEVNPENPNEYKFNGEWVEFEKRTESIDVKNDNGEIETVTREFQDSVHGPIIFKDDNNTIAYSKKWAFRGTEADSWAAYLKMNYAKSRDDFATAAREYTMSLNWFYADKNDEIAYYHVGQIPERDERVDWRFPTPGTGEYEWKGFLDTAENPHEVNPERGFVANWNNKPAPNWNTNEQNYMWGADHRNHQFIDRISERNKLTMEDVNEVNYEASFVNLRTRWFKPFLLEALSVKIDSDPKYKEAYSILEDWNNLNEDKDNDGHYDSAGATIMKAWWDQFFVNVTEEDIGKFYEEMRPFVDHRSGGSSLLTHLVQGEKAALQVENDWLKGRKIEEIARESFDQVVVELETEYGVSMKDWIMPIETMTFGAKSLIGVPHGLGDQQPIIFMNRGSENHFVEMTENGPVGMNITPPGQVGFIKQDGEYSQHYKDQIEMFKNFEYKQMLFEKEDVLEHAVETFEIDIQKEK
ncbi:hypothetical protein CSV61_09595 [Sporosarcina sp. P3]|uniref:penicillin acylase family protein n=1 Tax=Sporosarcina sp. P3 TaxID=2048245 RepID=UPI000C168411|nr:penicillin acylase family protein [Sporosarcina sp. P3]PID21469.1 hypothetical protein CSV61_09595 [Sporosarcina sp. P3]